MEKEVKRGLLILFITIIVFIFLFEFFLRIFVDTYDFSGESIPDDELSHVLNKSFSSIQQTKDHEKVNLTINQCGFRSNELNSCYFKSNSSYKILIMGDSFTYGRGVNNNETYPYYLETLLENTEVLNAGISAYGPIQELLYLKRIINKTNPDLVILGFYDNDVNDIGKFSLLYGSSQDKINNHFSFYKLKNSLRKNFRIYDFVTSSISHIHPLRVWLCKRGVLSKEVSDVFYVYADNPPDFFKEYFTTTEKTIAEMDSISKEFLLVHIPSQGHFNEEQRKDVEYYNHKFINSSTNISLPNSFLKNVSEKNNISLLDLTVPLSEIYDKKQLYLKIDGHFSKHGNYETARIIKDYLLENNFSNELQ